MKYVIMSLLLVVGMSAYAETVTWVPNQQIEIPVDISAMRKEHNSRMIYFPSKSIAFNEDWSNEDLQITRVSTNGLQVMLKTNFTTNIHIIGDDGNIYELRIRPSYENEKIDSLVEIKPKENPSGSASSHNKTTINEKELKGESIALMRHMLGGIQMPGVKAVPDGVYTNGEFKVGRPIYQTDLIDIKSTRMYRAQNVIGYQMLVTYHGTEPSRLDYKRLYFKGALCVHASGQVFLDPNNPGANVNRSLVLHFIAEAE